MLTAGEHPLLTLTQKQGCHTFTTMTLKKRRSKTCSTVPEKTVQAGMDRGSRLGRHEVGGCCESFTSAIRNQIVSLSRLRMIYAASRYSPTAGD